MKIDKQKLIEMIKEEFATMTEAGRAPGGGFYYGPNDYSRRPGGSWEHDRSSARSSAPESSSEPSNAAKVERCKEKGMKWTIHHRTGKVICVHEEGQLEEALERTALEGAAHELLSLLANIRTEELRSIRGGEELIMVANRIRDALNAGISAQREV